MNDKFELVTMADGSILLSPNGMEDRHAKGKRIVKWINSSLKLQELVKEMIKSNGKDLKERQKSRNYQGWCAESIIDEALQSLVKDSKKN